MTRAAGVLLAFGLVLAASAQAAGPPSPCKLATVAQVKAAFGGAVAAGRIDNSLPSGPQCIFHVKRSNLGVDGDAIVFVTPGQSAATFRIAKKTVPGAVTVNGIATGAFYNPHTTSIELLKGNAVASAQGVFLGTSNGAKIKADVILLAKAVAGHL